MKDSSDGSKMVASCSNTFQTAGHNGSMKKLPLGRKEKEDRIVQLIREGKTIREIAVDEHVSFSEIARIRRKYFEEDDYGSGKKSIRVRALELIDQGKSNYDIARELDISSDNILEFRREYLTLKGLDELLIVYKTNSKDVPDLLKLYHQMKSEDISTDDAVWALKEYGSFKKIDQEYESKTKQLRPLSEKIEELSKEVNELQEKRDGLEDEVDGLVAEKLDLEYQIKELSKEKENQSKIVYAFREILGNFDK
jgi:DNA-binding CsgD family transcriptional regulator